MERGNLRPVPLRPAGPVEPAEALRHVTEALPGLDEQARRALALVEIGGRSRHEVAVELSLHRDAVSEALYRGRKALRRSIFPLAASGWCERAERLLSDRLDGVLEPPGPERLDAHLRHCARCVEHERRLAQARAGLMRAFGGEPEEVATLPLSPVQLRVVDGEPEAPVQEPIAPPLAQPPEPEVATHHVVAQGGVVWTALYVLAVLLAMATVVLTVLAATGVVERVF